MKFLRFLSNPQQMVVTSSKVRVPTLETICSKLRLKSLFKTKIANTSDIHLFFKKKNPNLPKALWA